jgi:hypothetical protein
MTAEIAIMNKHGVALAADSKVTISSSLGQKTFDTVNKVFTLSKVHPVGIMVFGNAEFMRYPWETIVKLYRSSRGNAFENTIVEWGSSFVDYVKTFGHIRDEDKIFNIYSVLNSVFRQTMDQTKALAKAKGIKWPSEEYEALLKEVLEQRVAELTRLDNWFDTVATKAIVNEFGGVINTAIDEHFSAYDDDLKHCAGALAILAIAKDFYSPSYSSGIVVAGFGEKEIFPTLVEYVTDGYIGDKLKISKLQEMDISRDLSAAISAFAQKEMVQRFMTGADGELMSTHFQLFGSSLETACLEILENYGKDEHKTSDVRDAIHKASLETMKKLWQISETISERNFSYPIIDMVSLLPKEELPLLAESLVGLTSLKRHVSTDIETVGGAIDVALISKSDGFIWIKRKHYFRPELNPHFAHNYMRGIDPGGAHETPRPNASARKGTRKSRRKRASS